jgi:hypothetical protein
MIDVLARDRGLPELLLHQPPRLVPFGPLLDLVRAALVIGVVLFELVFGPVGHGGSSKILGHFVWDWVFLQGNLEEAYGLWGNWFEFFWWGPCLHPSNSQAEWTNVVRQQRGLL